MSATAVRAGVSGPGQSSMQAETHEEALMRIAQVAPLYESCPPQLYGGTERVVSYLTEELVKEGVPFNMPPVKYRR